MGTYNVRDAFQLLKERGIARDKQEVRKWLNEGYIEAAPPENRRVGWKIPEASLQTFILRFEQGEFEALHQRRKAIPQLTLPGVPPPAADADSPVGVGIAPQLVRMEEEVGALRQQVRVLRRELNDLKKVLGFPVLAAAEQGESPNASARRV